MNTTPHSILSDNADQTALTAVKAQEKPMLASLPPNVQVAQPSSLMQKYVDTGDSIFKEAAGHAMNVLNDVGGLLSSTQTITDDPADDREAELAQTLSGIASNESGGVKGDKYMAVHVNNNGVRDLGKYQVNEKTLQSYGKQYLGTTVTPAQFLASPSLQEQFATKRLSNWQSQGYDKDEMASMWHNGSNSIFNPDDSYVKEFDETQISN